MTDTQIDDKLVRRLIATQFPKWKDLLIQPVANQGWDNRTFHLGENMLVRMPSALDYTKQVEKESLWLPKLVPLLPLKIPLPLVIGTPGENYPWKWAINAFLPGETATNASIADLCDFATSLAQFLVALRRIDPLDGPLAGPHSFYRGGLLAIYDAETRQALDILKDKIDVNTATEVWDVALATKWPGSPVWVHGDISTGNLLVEEGELIGVIDFGQLAVGDPACDLAIAWTLFKGDSRDAFRVALRLDSSTWARGRGWALWKALIVCAAQAGTNYLEVEKSWRVIDEVLADYSSNPY